MEYLTGVVAQELSLPSPPGLAEETQPFRPQEIPVPMQALPKDLPVYGTASAGNGDFVMATGEAIDHVRRPPGLARTKGAYGIYVEGVSMQPAHDPGDLVYVDPNRKPMIGRDCIIQLRAKAEGDDPRCMLKRLVRRAGSKLTFAQFNPARDIVLDEREIAAMHLVLKNHEVNV